MKSEGEVKEMLKEAEKEYEIAETQWWKREAKIRITTIEEILMDKKIR